MAANTQPIFTLSPGVWGVRISSGNANRDGSGSPSTLVTGATNGTRIDRVTAVANVTTTNGMVRFFLDDGSGTIRLIRELPVVATTPSASAVAWAGEWARGDGLPLLVLPSGYILKATMHNSEQVDIVAYGGSY